MLPPFSVLPYLPSVIKSESFSLRVYGLWRARGRHSDRLLCADFARGPWPSTTRRVSQRPAALREEARLTGRLDPSHIYSHFPPPPKRETSDSERHTAKIKTRGSGNCWKGKGNPRGLFGVISGYSAFFVARTPAVCWGEARELQIQICA